MINSYNLAVCYGGLGLQTFSTYWTYKRAKDVPIAFAINREMSDNVIDDFENTFKPLTFVA